MDIDIRSRLCYNLAMKRIILTLICLFSLLPTVEAKFDANQLIGGLLSAIEDAPAEAASHAQQKKQDAGLGEQMALMARTAVEPLIDSYKQEGREYAREVGDIITQRILEAKKINETIDSVRILCWVVILYLTLVTFIMIFTLLRLRVLYTKLSAKIEEIKGGE